MPEISTLILTADARDLAKAVDALNKVADAADATEATVNQSLDAVQKQMENTAAVAVDMGTKTTAATVGATKARKAQADQEAQNAAAAKAAAAAEATRASQIRLSAQEFQNLRMSLDSTYAMELRYNQALQQIATAEKLGIASKREAEAAQQALTSKYQEAAIAARTLQSAQGIGTTSMGDWAYQARLVSQQLSQVAQMTMVTGHFVQALAIQLPDIGLAFGIVGTAAGVLAGIALPLIVQWFGSTGEASKAAEDQIKLLNSTLDTFNQNASIGSTSVQDLAKQYGQWAGEIQQTAQWMAQVNASQAIDELKSKTLTFSAALDQVQLAQDRAVASSRAWLQAQQAVANGVGDPTLVQNALDAFGLLNARVDELTVSLGLSGNQALVLGKALSDVKGSQNIAEMRDRSAEALEVIKKLYPNLALLPPEVASAAEELQKVVNKTSDSLTLTRLMTPALNNATGAAGGLAGAMGHVQMAANAALSQMVALAQQKATLQGQVQAAAAGFVGMPQFTQADLVAQRAAVNLAKSQILIKQNEDAMKKLGTTSGGATSTMAKGMDDATKAAKAYADAMQQPVVSAIDSVSTAFGTWISKGFKDSQNLFKSLISGFQNAIAQMIALTVRNKILVSLGLSSAVTGGAANAGVAGGGGITNLAGMAGNLGGSFSALGGLVGMGGGTASLGGAAAGVASGSMGLMAALPAIGVIVAGIGFLVSAFKSKPIGSSLDGTYNSSGFSGSTSQQSSSFFGLFHKTSSSAMDPATQQAVQDTLGGLKSSVHDMVTSLGVDASSLNNFAASFSINTFGMSADQAAQALSNAIASVGLQMVDQTVAVKAYAKAGETSLDTLTRLSQAITPVNNQLTLLGHSIFTIGLQGADAASKLADAFGGVANMGSALQTYVQAFYTPEQQIANETALLTKEFAALGVSLPTTRAGFVNLINAQDLNTDAGRKMFAALVSLAGAMNQILPVISSAISSVNTALADMLTSTSSGVDSMIANVTLAQNAALSAAKTWYDAAQSLRDYIAELRGTTSDLVSAQAARAANEARFQALMDQVLSGSVTAAGQLTGVAKDLLGNINDTAGTSAEAAVAQAKIMQSLLVAANISDAQGGQQDVIASLLGDEKDLLTQIKAYLAGGGVLDPSNIDALNAQLGALQGAITDAKSVDYATILAHMDATVVVTSSITDPVLKNLLESATHSVETSLDFVANTDGLTPAERFLALENVSQHLRTIDLVTNSTSMTLADKTLALTEASTIEKTIQVALSSNLTDVDKSLVLVQSNNMTRTINLALGTNISPLDRALALATNSTLIRTVNAYLAPFAATHPATILALADDSGLVRTVNAYITPGRSLTPGVLLGLATASSLTRTVNAILGSGGSADAVHLALAATSSLTRSVTAAMASGSQPQALLAALAVSSGLTRSVTALVASGASVQAINLALATGGTITQMVTAAISAGASPSAITLALSHGSDLIRTVNAYLATNAATHPATILGLAGNSVLLRTVNAAKGVITPGMLSLALAQDSTLTKTIIAGVDTSHLTADQVKFLQSLTGVTSGTITLGGSFQWDPSTGFQAWYEQTTKGSIADPLALVDTGLTLLRTNLTALTAAIIADIAQRAAADQAARDAAAKAAALAAAQAHLSSVAGTTNAAFTAAQNAVNAINSFDAGNHGNLVNAAGDQVHMSLNPNGTLNYNGAVGVNGTAADIAAWKAMFWNTGGLEDQAQAAAASALAAQKTLDAARAQVIALGGIPAFVNGGFHNGGLRKVGEKGVEIEATGPARYYSASQTADMLRGNGIASNSNSPVVKALKDLQDMQMQISTKAYVLLKRGEKLMESWEANGLPPARPVL